MVYSAVIPAMQQHGLAHHWSMNGIPFRALEVEILPTVVMGANVGF